MKKRFAILYSLLISFSVWLGSCTAQNTENVLTPDAYEIAVSETENAVIIDVRTPKEYQASHLENATNVNVLDGNFKTQIAKLDKNTTYYIYCRSGKRSARAHGIMKALGFQKVYDLKGGFLAWNAAKKKVVQ
ncbi:MAG: rhodanese-like domain-containing protein [Flavobacteriaceae bacterium]|nr:rhodanese-like domain-containing protein [Flavobacteriaceae bacterium]